MNKTTFLVAVSLISAIGLPNSVFAAESYGSVFKNNGFVKDDWQVVCDNTLTCRAAGYSAATEFNQPASIKIVAEPESALPDVYVKVSHSDYESLDMEFSENIENGTHLWLNNIDYGEIADNAKLTDSQTEALISRAKSHTLIEIKNGNDTWRVSDKGMAAVLLKLDDTQGRVGTPIALVSKNYSIRQTPKSAEPIPIISKGVTYSDNDYQLSATRLQYLNQHITDWVDVTSEQFMGSGDNPGECELLNPDDVRSYGAEWAFIALDENHTLASHPCWRAAYNGGIGYWVINNDAPNEHKLVTTNGSSYDKGKIQFYSKGRGIGDCASIIEWTWNGSEFVLSKEVTTGLCRGFAGGAWELPTYVSEVQVDSLDDCKDNP